MATTDTDAFPTNDTEYSVVNPAVNTTFIKFDYKNQGAQNNEQLKAHDVNIDDSTTSKYKRSGSIQWLRVYWWPSYQQYRWKNASSPAVHNYAALFHLKRWLATGIDTAINMWCASKKSENSGAEPEYKVGVKGKTLFKKNHIDLFHPETEALE